MTIGYLDQQFGQTEFFDRPYPVYAELQLADPIHWSAKWNAWIITRYDDVLAVLRNTQDFSSAGRQMRILQQLTQADQDNLRPLKQHYATGGLINTDPPDHTRLRKLVNKAFTPRAVNKIQSRIQQIVDELLDVASEKVEIDLIQDFAYPLPAIVIAEMLGAPAEDREQFRDWSEQINAFLGTGQPDATRAHQAQAAMLALKAYLRGLLSERLKQPRNDLLTDLAMAEEDGDNLHEDELLATCVTLLIAGHETTTNLIGNGLLALLRHADQLTYLRQHEAAMPAAIEELLRYDGPVHSVKRVASTTVEMQGKQLAQGALIYLMLGAANRDPEHFTDAHSLDIHRGDTQDRPIPFGYGIHYCVGAPLARLEANIALSTLFRRFAMIDLNGKPEWKPNISVRGLQTLPITLKA